MDSKNPIIQDESINQNSNLFTETNSNLDKLGKSHNLENI